MQLALSAAAIEALGGDTAHRLFNTGETVHGSDSVNANTAWTDTLYNWHRDDTIQHLGTIGLTSTDMDNDSIGYIESSTNRVEGTRVDDSSMGDTLMLVNQDTTNATKNFNAPADGAGYTAQADLGSTKGTLNINGVAGGDAETVNLNNHSGFALGEGAVALNLNNVTLGGNTTVATVSNKDAVLNLDNAIINGAVDGSTLGDDTFVMSTTGTSELNGAVSNANITNTGTLTTTAENISASSITNNDTLNLSGALAKEIAGNGTTNINSTLTLNNGASIAGTLNMNSGSLTVSAGSVTSHNINKISGNGNMAIDLSVGGSADKLTTTALSTGTITLSGINVGTDLKEQSC